MNREIELQNLISNLVHGKPLNKVPYCDVEDMLCVMVDNMWAMKYRASIMIKKSKNNN